TNVASRAGERGGVGANGGDRVRGDIDEDDHGRPARERLEPDRPRAREGVEEPASGQPRGQDVEERLPHAGPGRPGGQALRRLETSSLPGAADDPGHYPTSA